MLNLAALTSDELHQLDAALTALDEALLMCQDARAIDADGCDLLELAEAVGTELEWLSNEDAKYVVDQAMKRGECFAVVRPDGEVGYAPTGE